MCVCVCVCVCRMATKLLRLAADEKREAKRDGHPPSGTHTHTHTHANNSTWIYIV